MKLKTVCMLTKQAGKFQIDYLFFFSEIQITRDCRYIITYLVQIVGSDSGLVWLSQATPTGSVYQVHPVMFFFSFLKRFYIP